MPRYIDADYLDELITQLIKEGRNITRNDYKMIDSILFEFPTADVVDKERYDRLLENSTIIADALSKYQSTDMVEVVRCKDCCHNEGSLSEPWCRIYECRKSNNGFCDEGKRKEIEDE